MKTHIQIAVAILLIGVLIASYQIYAFQADEVPRMEAEKRKIDAEIATREAELKKLEDFAQNIETIKQDLKELNLQLESALDYMPRNFNFSALLRKLTMLAQNSGVELSSFRPHKDDGKPPPPGVFYSSLAIEFDLRGTFTQTLVFLDQLSRLKRIVNVDSLKMHVTETQTQHPGNLLATTQAIIRTYRFVE